MSDTFGSIISNNMNGVMKKLTVVTVAISVPTFITSFWGMNVDLPFAKYGMFGCAIITLLCLFAVTVTLFRLSLMDRTKSAADKEKKKQNRAKRSEIRKLKKKLEAQELNLEAMK